MKKIYFLLVTLVFASLSFGQEAVITSYLDSGCPSQAGRTVEIYVDGSIDFTGWNLVRQSNGGGFSFTIDISSLGTISDDFAYITNSSTTIEAEFGITTNVIENTNVNGNGDDGWQLTDSGDTIIDRFGVDGEDATGFDWEHLDSYAYRVDGVPANGGTFVITDFTYGALNLLDNQGLCNSASALSNLVPFGSFTTTANTDPTVTITSPNNNQALDSGTATVNIEFTVANAPGATVNITVTEDGSSPVTTNNITSPFEITPTVDGESYTVSIDLVDGGVLDTDTIDFSIAFPCDLQVGTITTTCDAITEGDTDTYNVSIEYTGGASGIFTIDTNGVGTVGGDSPNVLETGIITITGITEGTDFSVNFIGNPANSSCNFIRNINSPNCDPQLILPITETFTYADGSLGGNSEWVTHGGTEGDLQVVSGQALVQHGLPSEDINLPFTPVTGELFFAFDMTIPDVGVPIGDGGTDFEYFAHFKDTGFGFVAQVDVVAPTGTGDYTVGISSDQNTADATWATDLAYDTTYRITVRYNQDTNIAELWVDAAAQGDTSILGADEADPGDSVASFAFRQSDSSENEGILVDNLVIAQTFAQTVLSTNDFETSEFTLYPNPTNLGYVNIASSNSDAINVQVFDILGKNIKNEGLTNNQLNVSDLNTGIYILKITQNNASITKKLVIR